MAWLVRDEQVLATVEVADSLARRARGLLGRDGIDGAILLPHVRSVHTLGMRFPIDVAFLDGGWKVVDLTTMGRHRLGRPRFAARRVVEAEAGAFERWRLCVGDVLELRE